MLLAEPSFDGSGALWQRRYPVAYRRRRGGATLFRVVSDNRPDDVLLEVNGPDVHPWTVDSVKLLEFGSAYLELLQKIAAEEETSMSFRGISIEDKCVALRVQPADAAQARHLADLSTFYVGGHDVPKGLGGHVARVQKSLRAFPLEYEAKVIIGPWAQRIAVPEASGLPDPPFSIESVRATILRVGGAEPRVRVRPVHEAYPFSMHVKVDDARKLGERLYGEADLTIRVLRSSDDRVLSAELIDFDIVSDEDAGEAWRAWFRPYVEHWDQIRDIEGELRRDRSD